VVYLHFQGPLTARGRVLAMWDKADHSARWAMRGVGVVASLGLLAFGTSEVMTGDWATGLAWLVGGVGAGVMTIRDWSSA
jgi:hypothetical protein